MGQLILVTGATGNQGGAVARHLLGRGFEVRALVRDAGKDAAQVLARAGASLAEGDLSNRASLLRAVEGAHGVFSVQASHGDSEGEIAQARNLAEAAREAGVEHFLYSSAAGAGRGTGVPAFSTKAEIEEQLGASGLRHTILRPVSFFYNYKLQRAGIEAGTLAGPLSPSRKLQQISEDDYAEMVAQVFERPGEFAGRAIEVATAEATMDETAASFGEALGRPVSYQQIPFEAFEARAGRHVAPVYRWFEDVGYSVDFDAVKKSFGAPSSFEAYLRANGWAGAREALLQAA